MMYIFMKVLEMKIQEIEVSRDNHVSEKLTQRLDSDWLDKWTNHMWKNVLALLMDQSKMTEYSGNIKLVYKGLFS